MPTKPNTINITETAHPAALLTPTQRDRYLSIGHENQSIATVLLTVGAYNALPDITIHSGARDYINKRDLLQIRSSTGEVFLTTQARAWLRAALAA